MEETIENKVANSGLITLDPADFYPESDIMVFDLKDYLYQELILREKEYRETLKNKDWSVFENKVVALTCSTDAIVPVWAYMLAVVYLEPYAKDIVSGTKEEVLTRLYLKNLAALDRSKFEDQRVVIKGCGDKSVPEAVYIELTSQLRPVVKSIMYGEPCSTVPIFKRK